jgi:hypothetical protein
MDDDRTVSVARFVAAAAAAALMLNLVMGALFGLPGIPVAMGVAFFSAGLAAWWFAKSVGRAPTRRERSRFLWSYAGIVALPFVAAMFLAVSRGSASIPGLVILFLYYIPYPAFAQMFFSEKYFTMALKK